MKSFPTRIGIHPEPCHTHRSNGLRLDIDRAKKENAMIDEKMLDGVFFVETLRRDAQEKGINQRLVGDWHILADWLNSDGSPLTPAQSNRVLYAWRAYVAIGLAPSFKLQEAFDTLGRLYLQQHPDCKSDKPPTNVMDVFDRMIATDTEIAEKRAADLAAERAKFEPIISALAATKIYHPRGVGVGVGVEPKLVATPIRRDKAMAVWMQRLGARGARLLLDFRSV